MRNQIVVIFCLFVCQMSAPINVGIYSANTLVQDGFPNINPRNQTGGIISADNPNLIEVSKLLKSYEFNMRQVFQPQTFRKNPVEIDSSQGTCNSTTNSFKSRVSFYFNQLSQNQILIPGNIVSLNQLNNLFKGLNPVSIKAEFRNTMKVNISNGIEGSLQYSDPSQFSSGLNQIISTNIAKLNAKPIKVYINQQSEIEKVLRYLNLPTEVYKQVGLATESSQTDLPIGKITVVLFQDLFSASLDFSSNPNFLEFFFNNQLTTEYIMKFTPWKTANIPNFIEQVNFGRLLIITVDDTQENRKRAQDLSATFASNKLENQKVFNDILTALLNDPSAKTFSKGSLLPQKSLSTNTVDASNTKLTRWQDIFYDLPQAHNNYLELIEPMTTRVRTIFGRYLQKVEQRFFNEIVCDNQFKVELGIIQVSNDVQVSIRRKGQKEFGKDIGSYRGYKQLDLTKLVDKQPFEVRMRVKGNKLRGFRRFFGMSDRYKLFMNYELKINGKPAIQKTFGSLKKRSKRQRKELILSVDPKRRRVIPRQT